MFCNDVSIFFFHRSPVRFTHTHINSRHMKNEEAKKISNNKIDFSFVTFFGNSKIKMSWDSIAHVIQTHIYIYIYGQ